MRSVSHRRVISNHLLLRRQKLIRHCRIKVCAPSNPVSSPPFLRHRRAEISNSQAVEPGAIFFSPLPLMLSNLNVKSGPLGVRTASREPQKGGGTE